MQSIEKLEESRISREVTDDDTEKGPGSRVGARGCVGEAIQIEGRGRGQKSYSLDRVNRM